MKFLSELFWWEWLILGAVVLGLPVLWWKTDRTKKSEGKGYKRRTLEEWFSLGVNVSVSIFLFTFLYYLARNYDKLFR